MRYLFPGEGSTIVCDLHRRLCDAVRNVSELRLRVVCPGEESLTIGGASAKDAAPGNGSAILTHGYTPTHDRGLPCQAGEPVTVLRTEPEWVRVRNLSGSEGWVPVAFLKMSKVAGEPSAPPPPPTAAGELGEGLTGGVVTAL